MKTATLNSALPNKWLLGALLITVALTLWAFLQDDSPESEVIELAESRSNSPASNINKTSKQAASKIQVAITMQDGAIAWQQLKRKPLENPVENPFKVHSWLVVPPVKKVKPEPPPPPPVAPPVPFAYMGKLENTPKNTQIFLVANGKLYTVRTGEKIDQQWRLDAEEANALRLTYLPLNLPQMLSKAAKPLPMAAPVAEANL